MAVTLEPFHPDLLYTIVDVVQRSLPAEAISVERFTRQVLLDPNFRREGALLARIDGSAAGFVLAVARETPLENAPPDVDRGYITLLGVLPQRRRNGVGGELLSAAEAYLRDRGRSSIQISPYAPGYFTPGVDVAAYADGLTFLLNRGYGEVYRPVAMETSLWMLDVPQWLRDRETTLLRSRHGFSPYNDGQTVPLLEFTRREFPGDWVRVVREAMGRILDGEHPTRLIVARSGDQVVGFCHHDGERFGPIGVAASERGRGVGQVLMFKTLRAMREQGYRTGWFLWSDDRTARRLYDAAGFREVRRFAVLRKNL